MSKIKNLERQFRTLERKNAALDRLEDKAGCYNDGIISSFLLALLTSFVVAIIGLTLESLEFSYIDEANFVLMSIIGLGFLNVVFSLIVSLNVGRKVDEKKYKINKKYPFKRKDLMISLEDVDDYLKELESMSDEEVDQVPSFIVNEIIARKKEKEKKEISKNSIRLKEALLRKENQEMIIVND